MAKKHNLLNSAFSESRGGWRAGARGIAIERSTKWQGPRSSRSYRLRQSFRSGSGGVSISGGLVSPFGHKAVVLGIVLVAVILGGAWVFTPKSQGGHGGPADPNLYTILSDQNAPSGDLAAFNCQGGGASYQTGLVTGGAQLRIAANLFNQECVTKTVVGDFSAVAGKHLAFQMFWKLTGGSWPFNGTANNRFVMFLTRNATVTHGELSPWNDPSVALIFSIEPISGGTNYIQYLFIQKQAGETIQSEDNGGCGVAGSCYFSEQTGAGPALSPGTNIVQSSFWLNFTGNSRGAQGTNCAASGTFPQGGGGCSVIITTISGTVTSWTGSASPTQPQFLFQGVKYYMGFWVPKLSNTSPQFDILFDKGSGFPTSIDPTNAGGGMPGSMSFAICQIISTPVTVAPSIDATGWFGLSLNGLVNMGVLMLNAIMGFVGFLLPAITAAFNVIGGFFGLGALGTNIVSFFAAVAAWFGTIFSNVIGQAGNVVTFIVNGITLFGVVGGNFFSGINQAFTAFINMIGFLQPIMNLIILSAHMSISTLWCLWMFVGMMQFFKSFEAGMGWFRTTEMIFLKVFKFIYWVSEEVFKLVARLRTTAPRPAGI